MRALGSCSALFVALWLCLALRVEDAQASFEFTRPRWDSSSELLKLAREKLGPARVVLGAELDWAALQPEDAVLVLHPQTRLQFAEVSAFLAGGGRLALVDDFGKGETLLNRFRIQRVTAPAQPLETLHNNPNLQLARPAHSLGRAGAGLTHPMVEGIDHVVTNHPSALITSSDVELTPVLNLADQKGEQHLFAVIGVIGDVAACGLEEGPERHIKARCGRLFAMADPSVFIDLMLNFEGNRQLADALIEYLLQDDGWGPRQGKLYILSNEFSQTGHYGEEETLRQRVSEWLDSSSEWLATTRKEGLPKRLVWGLAAALCVAVAVATFRMSGRTYERPTPRYATPTPLVAQGGVMGRASVLSSSTTSSTLVVLELKQAAEAFLRERLQLPRHASSKDILERLAQAKALTPATQMQLHTTFGRMARAETAVLVAPENTRFSAESITQMQAVLSSVIEQLEDHLRRQT